ncbi:DNA repair protein RecN [Suttonella sp. R2A3]|uniref:DNA repair protein RecN n=1 Tax=Suttonella sp. R2A3 TaxID=2908648 RepID=UPI001F01293B|nr:DNA repair protein RecN [Suttonella sp. R2A3]UJF24938.1 DNA repair protein RecN [Suttonella sp. R2A3]
MTAAPGAMMLEALSIEQLAIIERSSIHFQPGFNVLTGETGAGKSILIDAVSLALGERADSSAIRHGAEQALVQALFSAIPEPLQNTLADEALANDDMPSECIIRRSVRENGSKAFCNDKSVTSAKLRNLSESLLSIHGQHSNQSLIKSEAQRERLDRFASNEQLLEKTSAAYRSWQQLTAQYQDWQNARSEHEERLSLLRYQLDELEEINPQTGEFETISAEQHILANADNILSQGGRLLDMLQDSDQALTSGVRQAQHSADALHGIDPRFAEIAELLSQSAIYLDEAADALNRQLSRIEHDPQQLAEIETRMNALHTLARKHHRSPDELGAHWQDLQQEYDALSSQQDSQNQLEAQCQQAEAHYQKAALELREARKKATLQLAKDVQQWIRQLGMVQAEFKIEVEASERASIHGLDRVTFHLCANPGQALQPLAKVASGGELSRVSLAIEVACLDEAPVPTVIFDEIDAGIGGEVADTVGRLLQRLSQNRQVLCITHLPQVAVYADHHLYIEKTSDQNSTLTSVHTLDQTKRIQEIARMLGSAESETSRGHAQAMLDAADNHRRG